MPERSGSEQVSDAVHRRGRGRRAIVEMAVGGVIASVVGVALALWIDWFPAQGSTQAETIDTFWDVLLICSVPIAILVFTVVIVAVREFRMRPGEENLDGPPIHGNTKLEVIWTTLPALILVSLCTYAWIVLVDIEKAPANAEQERRVFVTGEQFTWTFEYREPGQEPFKTSQLYLPEGESVKFVINSSDVLHSFWIPEMRMKIDAVPGIDTSYRITPKRTGRFPIVCAELCGLGHAFMRQTAHILPASDFGEWVAQRTGRQPGTGQGGAGQGDSEPPAQAVDGKQVYAANGCGSCHALADAGTSGGAGPNLDNSLKGKTAAYVRESIVDPGAVVASGFSNIMPSNFDETLSPEELDALVDYLVEATK